MLINIQDLRDYLQLEDTSEDMLLSDIIKASSTAIEKYCNRTFIKKEHSELLEGTNYLYPANTPVESVISVLKFETLEEVQANIFKDTIILPRNSYVTLSGAVLNGNVEEKYIVNYVGGYNVVPNDIKQIVLEMSAIRYKKNREETLDIKSRNEAGLSTSYVGNDLILDEYKATLDLYKVVDLI